MSPEQTMDLVTECVFGEYINILLVAAATYKSNRTDNEITDLVANASKQVGIMARRHLSDGASQDDKRRMGVDVFALALAVAKGEETL